jgi:hypothetical protein
MGISNRCGLSIQSEQSMRCLDMKSAQMLSRLGRCRAVNVISPSKYHCQSSFTICTIPGTGATQTIYVGNCGHVVREEHAEIGAASGKGFDSVQCCKQLLCVYV